MIDLAELEAIKTKVARSLPDDVVETLRRAGMQLTLSSLPAVPEQAFQPVVVDEKITDELVEQELDAEMVSYRKNVTGVDHTIFFSVEIPRHAPRIKVAIDPPTHLDPTGNNASVRINDGEVIAGDVPARLLKQVRRFIEIIRDTILKYWNKEIDTDELRQQLKQI